MGRLFVKVSEEEIEEAFFFIHLICLILKQVSPSGSVKSGGYNYIYLDASHLGIYPPLFTSPSGDSCIISTRVWYNYEQCVPLVVYF